MFAKASTTRGAERRAHLRPGRRGSPSERPWPCKCCNTCQCCCNTCYTNAIGLAVAPGWCQCCNKCHHTGCGGVGVRSPLDNWPAKVEDWPHFSLVERGNQTKNSRVCRAPKIGQSPTNVGQLPIELITLLGELLGREQGRVGSTFRSAVTSMKVFEQFFSRQKT